MDKQTQFTLNKIASELIQEAGSDLDPIATSKKLFFAQRANDGQLFRNSGSAATRQVGWGAQKGDTVEGNGLAIQGAINSVADGSYKNDPDYVPPKSTVISGARDNLRAIAGGAGGTASSNAEPGYIDQSIDFVKQHPLGVGLGVGVPLALAGSYLAYKKMKENKKQ